MTQANSKIYVLTYTLQCRDRCIIIFEKWAFIYSANCQLAIMLDLST